MFLHTGLQNYVTLGEIQAMSSNVYSAPTKRSIKAAETEGNLIDHTEGRKTRSVIFLVSGAIVLSCVETQTLKNRVNTMLAGDIPDEEDTPEDDVEPVATPTAVAATPAPVAAPVVMAKLPTTNDVNPATGKKYTKAAIAALKTAAAAAAAPVATPADGGMVTDLPD